MHLDDNRVPIEAEEKKSMATEIKENIPGHWDDPDPDSGKTFCITIRPDGSRDPDTVQCSTMRHHWEREDDSFRALPGPTGLDHAHGGWRRQLT